MTNGNTEAMIFFIPVTMDQNCQFQSQFKDILYYNYDSASFLTDPEPVNNKERGDKAVRLISASVCGDERMSLSDCQNKVY